MPAPAAFGLALVVVLAALAGAADACTCSNGGSVVQRTPCECQCTADYAQPNCEWRNDAQIEVVIVFANTTTTVATSANAFSTREKSEAIFDHYQPTYDASTEPFPYKVVRRRTATEPDDNSEVHVIFRVRGDLVNALLVDAAAGPADWMASIGILRLFRYILLDSAAGSLAGSATVISFNAGNTTVPVPFGAIAWPVGALVALVMIPLSEAIMSALCFDRNDVPEEELEGQQTSPVLGAVSKEDSGYY